MKQQVQTVCEAFDGEVFESLVPLVSSLLLTCCYVFVRCLLGCQVFRTAFSCCYTATVSEEGGGASPRNESPTRLFL